MPDTSSHVVGAILPAHYHQQFEVEKDKMMVRVNGQQITIGKQHDHSIRIMKPTTCESLCPTSFIRKPTMKFMGENIKR